jgi:hypothetical protein
MTSGGYSGVCGSGWSAAFTANRYGYGYGSVRRLFFEEEMFVVNLALVLESSAERKLASQTRVTRTGKARLAPWEAKVLHVHFRIDLSTDRTLEKSARSSM